MDEATLYGLYNQGNINTEKLEKRIEKLEEDVRLQTEALKIIRDMLKEIQWKTSATS